MPFTSSDYSLELFGGTKWPQDGPKWLGTKWSWNEVTGYHIRTLCCWFTRIHRCMIFSCLLSFFDHTYMGKGSLSVSWFYPGGKYFMGAFLNTARDPRDWQFEIVKRFYYLPYSYVEVFSSLDLPTLHINPPSLESCPERIFILLSVDFLWAFFFGFLHVDEFDRCPSVLSDFFVFFSSTDEVTSEQEFPLVFHYSLSSSLSVSISSSSLFNTRIPLR